ncbi:MAG: YgjP-like metallopeptidase domain-containing protein [Bdellovibrionota bacterium]|nr:YgjP-like metallopeptidase domain-containing protein [Bdellovibrionota bacterium]
MFLNHIKEQLLKTGGKEISVEWIDGVEYLIYDGFYFQWKKRAYYRNINAKVYPDLKLTITTGKKAPKWFIIKFIEENRPWLNQSLQHHFNELLKLKEERLLPRPKPGGWAPLMGHAMRLEEAKSKREEGVDWKNKVLKVYPGKKSFLQGLFRFYKEEAKRQITVIQKEVSEKMGLYPVKLNFRKPKTQWGNCNSRKEITYNWKLIAAPYRWIEYVVVHETSHLQHMDHSHKFWELVASACPDYEKYSQALKGQQNIFEFLNEESNLYLHKFHFDRIDKKVFIDY